MFKSHWAGGPDWVRVYTPGDAPSPTGGHMLSPDLLRSAVRCWECDATIAQPRTVILATAERVIGKLALCPACYAACYLPLARRPADVEGPVLPLLLV